MRGHNSRCAASVRIAARAVMLMTVCALFAACAGKAPVPDASPIVVPEWSLGDAREKIEWVRTISDVQEAGATGGFWTRVGDLIAGTGAGVQGLKKPYGVVVDSAKRLYVSDPGLRMVHCLGLAKKEYTAIGVNAAFPLVSPVGLTLDDRDRLYITDSTAGMVYRYDPADGSLKPLLVKKLGRPTGIVYHPQNHLLYVVDTLAGQIVALDLNGEERKRIGGRGDGASQFNFPTEIAVSAKGELYVLDALNFRVAVMTPEGQPLLRFGEPGDAPGYFARPKGVAVDHSGHIYVGDSQKDFIQVFDGKGKLLTTFGGNGSGKGRFWGLSGMFIDSRDYIYVTDTFNRRIQVFRHLTGSEHETGGEPDFDSPE
jgi:DNA-binding beta-propeller fold protein YncE